MAVVVSSLPKLQILTWWKRNLSSRKLRQISRNIALSHRIVPVRVGNSGSLTVLREVLQIGGIGGFKTSVVSTHLIKVSA
jgi:hypothetical protein